jgi:hypothetical protein
MPVIQRLAAGGARGFGFGVGGVTYSGLITETATGADSVNGIPPYQGIITETATGADSTDGTSNSTYQVSTTETATGSDSISSSLILPGYASFDFNGAAYVDTPTSSTFATGSNDWTLQFFIYLRATPSSNTTVFDVGSGVVTNGWRVEITTSRQVRLLGLSSYNTTAGLSLNTWYFITVTRYSSPGVYIFIDSTRNTASSFNLGTLSSSTYCRIGGAQNNATRINALISNLQFRNNISVSSVTVPTTPLTNDANTLLLTCQNGTIIDNSTANGGSPWTLTNSGTTTTSTNPL